MHIKTKKRLIVWMTYLLSFLLGLSIILYNLSDNIAFFVTPTDLIQKPIYQEVKLGGYVALDSLRKLDVDDIEFLITDRTNTIKVRYKGQVPSIFREDQGVVVTGRLQDDRTFIANFLLAKHDEKYKPKKLK